MDFEGYFGGGGEEAADFLGVVGCAADYGGGGGVERAGDGHVGGGGAAPVDVVEGSCFVGVED